MLLRDRRLYLLFTPRLCAGDPRQTLIRALEGGVDVVQWRVPGGGRGGFAECLACCRQAGVPLIVNDDVAFAVESGADGAHVGQDDMPAARARTLLGRRLLGVSTHDLAQIDAAVADGADYLGFGPCHPTATKGYTEAQSPAAVSAAVTAAREAGVPLYGIGGITAASLIGLRALGVERIAVSSAILAAADARAAAAALRRGLSEPRRAT